MIGIERVGDVTTIELQRPERRNALNSELVDTLREAVQKSADDDVRAIVLTGAGTVFCAGADLSGDGFAADFPDKAIAL
ncbi:MAG: enoyl-CoA hydratase-related protein, partial [Mycobacterium sp.]|nr:enoyl-CoA hydratase-related protein [Mycobacterium sp.]